MWDICSLVGPRACEVQTSCGGACFSLEMCTHGWCPRSLVAVGVVRTTVWGPVHLGCRDFGCNFLRRTWSPGLRTWGMSLLGFLGAGIASSACACKRACRRVKAGRIREAEEKRGGCGQVGRASHTGVRRGLFLTVL